jgi:hypothetical protein
MGFNPLGFDEGAFDPEAFDFNDDPPPVLSDGYSGGTAVSGLGVMQTIFLADVEPVPVSARYINGIAHDSSGFRYVALWPASGIVTFSSGRALRPDGAQIVIQSAPTRYMAGIGYLQRGDMCVTTSPGSNFVQGFSVNSNGQVAVTEAS